MSTFAERKAQRVADSKKTFAWVVEDTIDFTALAIFANKSSAKEFAEKNLSVFLGDTAAVRALRAKHRNTQINYWHHFSIKKVEI